MAYFASPSDPDASRPTIAQLIEKHGSEIDRIMLLNPTEQMEAFRELGANTADLQAHYKGLQEKSDELRRRDAKANTRTAIAGFVGVIAATYAAYRKRMAISPNKAVQFFAIPLAGIGAGFMTTLFFSRLNSGGIREESRQLAQKSMRAFKSELAVLLENREAEQEQNVAASQHRFTGGVPARDPSYASQAVIEKKPVEPSGRGMA